MRDHDGLDSVITMPWNAWPRSRGAYIWVRTRERLDADQLAAELGRIDIPSTPLDTSAAPEQQAAS